MKLLSRRDLKVLVVVGVAFLMGGATVGYLADAVGLGLFGGALCFMFTGGTLFLVRRVDHLDHDLHERSANLFVQTEALVALSSSLELQVPLPPTRGWAASPDLLRFLVELIQAERPEQLLELGSGVSTLLIGYSLRKNGSGRLLSLDHEQEFANKTQRLVKLHDLGDHVTVQHAPLVPFQFEQKIPWYDHTEAGLPASIDFLLIDGPPGVRQPLARYPAVPLLYDRIQSGGVIVLDDGGRDAETAAVERWTRDYPDLEAEFISLEKGAWVIRKANLQDRTSS